MKNRMARMFFAALVVVSMWASESCAVETETAAAVSAGKSVTLQELTGFISAKWPEFVDGTVNYASEGVASSLVDTLNTVQFNQCDVVIVRKLSSTYNGRSAGSVEQQFTFNLKAIDKVYVGVYYNAQEGYTKDGAALMAFKLESSSGINKLISDKSSNYSLKSVEKRIEFAAKSLDNAISLADALGHAVRLCGGGKPADTK